jgi:hypothetical protein
VIEDSEHLAMEGRNVVRLSAGHKLPVDHDFHSAPALVRSVFRPGRSFPSARYASFNEHPGCAADHRNWLPASKKAFHKRHGFWFHTRVNRIHYSSRQQQSVKLVRLCLIERFLDRIRFIR